MRYIDIFFMRIYYIRMKILFAAISIIAAASAVAFSVLFAAKREKRQIARFAVCCCILAVAAVGYFLTPPQSTPDTASEVHVTVSPVKGSPAPVQDNAPSAPVQAQGAYTASERSDKFHLPSCSAASRISDANRVWFRTRDEAISAGYSPCGRCQP